MKSILNFSRCTNRILSLRRLFLRLSDKAPFSRCNIPRGAAIPRRQVREAPTLSFRQVFFQEKGGSFAFLYARLSTFHAIKQSRLSFFAGNRLFRNTSCKCNGFCAIFLTKLCNTNRGFSHGSLMIQTTFPCYNHICILHLIFHMNSIQNKLYSRCQLSIQIIQKRKSKSACRTCTCRILVIFLLVRLSFWTNVASMQKHFRETIYRWK